MTALGLLLLACQPLCAGVDAKRRELQKVQEELSRTRGELEAYRGEEESLDKEIKKLKGRSSEAGRKMDELRARMRKAEERKGELRLRLASLQAVSGSWKDLASSEMRRYAERRAVRGGSFGTEGLWAEELGRGAILEKTRLLSQLQGASRRTQAAAEETRQRARDLASKTEKALAEKKESELATQEKQAAFDQTREKAAAAARRAQELEESAKALTQLITQFLRSSKAAGSARAALAIPKHSLPWPAEGTVLAAFGREKNPDLGTVVIRQGIRIAVAADAPVAAVEAGKVIFAGPFRSYGQVVIVDHGSGLYSIYGELGRIASAKGRQVAAGEAIATAGAFAGRGVVYLELRHGSEALDPLQWLKAK